MDVAADEKDVRLQKASAELIADLDTSLKPFLWRTDEAGVLSLRRNVHTRELGRLINLLEPFQEDPQLLDPHLRGMLSTLTDAFLQNMSRNPRKGKIISKPHRVVLIRAVCKLLYIFCKIRGDKIIVRFFPTETRYLEPLTLSLENASASLDDENLAFQIWEERYITLLWLSHLQLLPFDLASISSSDRKVRPEMKCLIWPSVTPQIAVRVVALGVQYLASAGKERDAAKVLLMRISLRHDMQAIGLLAALIDWALNSLRLPEQDASVYFHIGILSYLAGILSSSSSTSDMDAYLNRIYACVVTLSDTSLNAHTQFIRSSVVARKNVIKILRAITVLELRSSLSSSQLSNSITNVVEETIQYLLEALADNDTPVRIAASKALSLITLKLAPSLVDQIVEAIIELLALNVVWTTRMVNGQHVRVRDLSAVNPFQWHGLILTLSQLLYRRAPPSESLSSILHALLVGLSFEVRATSGASVGSNVRDAACFGIWALARRYTTQELQDIDRFAVVIAEHYDQSCPILQILASELIVAATLDPAGNIRRGASAALQELIGRHPNTIDNGIATVQTVDYHKIALRSKALRIGVEAASLSKYNAVALLNGLLGWRGVGDPDASTRRGVARCLADIVNIEKESYLSLPQALQRTHSLILETELREVTQKHGLMLCMAEILFKLHTVWTSTVIHENQNDLGVVENLLVSLKDTSTRTPNLIIEAACQIINASCDLRTDNSPSQSRIRRLSEELLQHWLSIPDTNVQTASTNAALSLARTAHVSQLGGLLSAWLDCIEHGTKDALYANSGQLFALCLTYNLGQAHPAEQIQIRSLIVESWKTTTNVDQRVILLKALNMGTVLQGDASDFMTMIMEGLDDYTTDTRGDIGSWVRLQAIRATEICFKSRTRPLNDEMLLPLRDRIVRLAAEKFDKVRPEAAYALVQYISGLEDVPDSLAAHDLADTSSIEYFRHLIAAVIGLTAQHSSTLQSLLTGLIISADAGSESLILTTRQVLIELCTQNDKKLTPPIISTILKILKENLTTDRIAIPALEVIDHLFDEGIVQHSQMSSTTLFVLVQKAHFKSGNIRKLQAATRIYGGLLHIIEPGSPDQKKVLSKLVSMLLHPILVVRNSVVDVLWLWGEHGLSVDWGKVRKGAVELENMKRALNVS